MILRLVPLIAFVIGAAIAAALTLHSYLDTVAKALLVFERLATKAERDLRDDFTYLEQQLRRGQAFALGGGVAAITTEK